MQYICIKKVKGFFGFNIGDKITPERYSTLSDEKKLCFEENHEDEPIGDQISENLEKDNDD